MAFEVVKLVFSSGREGPTPGIIFRVFADYLNLKNLDFVLVEQKPYYF